MAKKYKWGILAAGKIAAKFVADLKLLPNAVCYAVASRDGQRAADFAGQWGIEKYYDSYEALANDPEVDIVYIASPHAFHKAHSMLCLSHGKAVLCEKAFALNYEDAQEMVDCACAHDVFLMEAFWTRFHPSFMRAKAIVDSGELGEIKYIRSDFGFKAPYDPHKRLFNVALGGGSLLDIGIYPVFLALQLLGKPEGIESVADFSPTGAEQSISMIFSYTTGQQASLYSSFCVDTSIVSEVFFTRARLLLNPRWHHAPSITLFHEDGRVEQEEFPITGMGYQFEAAEVMRCMDLGNRESELMPLSFTLQQMKVLDAIRAKAGIHFDR